MTRDPAVAQRVVFRTPGRYLSLFATVLIGAVAAGALGLTVVAATAGQWAVALVVLVCAAVVTGLFAYVLRDLRGRWGWRVAVAVDAVRLDLPAHRSLVQRLPAVHAQVAFTAIEAIETRFEAFRSLGMANMQRSVVLVLTDGTAIVLGEDRALATGLASSYVLEAATEIGRRSGVAIRDRGMAVGRGGLLSVVGAAAPAREAPAVSAETAGRLWRKAGTTGALAMIVVVLVLLLMLMFH